MIKIWFWGSFFFNQRGFLFFKKIASAYQQKMELMELLFFPQKTLRKVLQSYMVYNLVTESAAIPDLCLEWVGGLTLKELVIYKTAGMSSFISCGGDNCIIQTAMCDLIMNVIDSRSKKRNFFKKMFFPPREKKSQFLRIFRLREAYRLFFKYDILPNFLWPFDCVNSLSLRGRNEGSRINFEPILSDVKDFIIFAK